MIYEASHEVIIQIAYGNPDKLESIICFSYPKHFMTIPSTLFIGPEAILDQVRWRVNCRQGNMLKFKVTQKAFLKYYDITCLQVHLFIFLSFNSLVVFSSPFTLPLCHSLLPLSSLSFALLLSPLSSLLRSFLPYPLHVAYIMVETFVEFLYYSRLFL